MQATGKKKDAAITGLISCLNICLDTADAQRKMNRPGLSAVQRDRWKWIADAIETHEISLRIARMDQSESDYLFALIADYRAAVFPDDAEQDDDAELTLFAAS